MGPRSTPAADPKENRTLSDKITKTLTGTVEFIASANPQGKLGGSRTWANEQARTNETVQNKSAITRKKLNSIVSWAFDVDDEKEQKNGIEILGDRLPFVDFEFTDVFEDPSQGVDFVVASYWSKIPAFVNEKRRTWRQGIWNILKPASNASAPSYTNLCKIVSMKTTPSHLPVNSRYHAELRANPEGPSPLVYATVVAKQTDNSVQVTPHVIRGRYTTLLTCELNLTKRIFADGVVLAESQLPMSVELSEILENPPKNLVTYNK